MGVTIQELLEKLQQCAGVEREEFQLCMQEFGGLLRNERIIRVFIGDSANMGHQSSTVQMLFHLVDRFGYQGEVQIYYETQKGFEEVAQERLRLLFVQLSSEPVNQQRIQIREGVTVSFTDRLSALDGEVLFGFTGGADYSVIQEGGVKVDIAANLKVTFFLRLQPYLWSHLEEGTLNHRNHSHVEYGDRAAYQIAKDMIPSVDLDTHIHQFEWLAYKENTDVYDKSFIETMRTQINDSNPGKQGFENAAALFETEGLSQARLWPIYGLHNFGAVTPEGQIVMNLVISAMLFQQKGYREPIVMVMMNDFNAGQWEDFLSATNLFLNYPKGERPDESKVETWEKQLILSLGREQSRNQMNDPFYVKPNLAGFKKDFRALAENLELNRDECRFLIKDIDKLRQTNLSENCIYFLTLGHVPMGMFKYILSHAGLPPLFEGQGTSSFAMNTGKAYFQAALTGDSKEDENKDFYSFWQDNYLSLHRLQSRQSDENESDEADRFLIYCNQTAQTVVRAVWTFCDGEYDYRNKLEDVANFMEQAYTGNEDNEVKRYFRELRDYFGQDENEKLSQALLYLLYCIRQYGANDPVFDKEYLDRCEEPQKSKDAGEESGPKLTDVYQALQEKLSKGSSVDVVETFPQTSLAKYLKSINGKSFLLSDCQKLQTVYDDKNTLIKVVLAGKLQWTGGEVLEETELSFCRPDTSDTVQTRLVLNGNEDAFMEGIAWIALENIGLEAEIPEAGASLDSALTAGLKGTDLKLRVPFPLLNDKWYVEGSFETPHASLNEFFKIAGGVNFIQEMPAQLRDVGSFGLKGLRFQYDIKSRELEYMRFHLTTASAWSIVKTPEFSFTPHVDAVIYHVSDLEKRSVRFFIRGEFKISQATVTVKGQYPDFRLDASLSSGTLDLNDFVKLFGGSVDLKAKMTNLALTVYPAKKTYEISTIIDTDWQLADAFTIRQIGFGVSCNEERPVLRLAGKLDILPDDMNMVLSVSASYQNGGWYFTGKQSGDGVLQAGALLAKYLGWQIEAENLPVLNLDAAYDTSSGAWEFGAGTKDPWEVPFISGMKISGKLRIGKKKEQKEESGLVSYGRLEAEVTWQGIDLKVWYDYAPKTKSYGLTWNSLDALLKKDKDGSWTGEIKLNKETTVGEMISTMISWIRGSGFGLEAPWNALDSVSIPIDKFGLIYNFTTKQVSFSIEIGEIDLGFAKITGISVSYESGHEREEENGLMVSLQGEFPWNISGENGDTGNLGPWDASKPGSAPVPNGQGNKYFNLRTLALGQHVTVAGLTGAKTVDEVMKKISTLEKPEAGKLPTVTFDGDSGWLIGMDFDVLRLTGEGESGYMLKAMAVWNDPYLYGLSIQLAGSAAKIFKGLKFEIMYKRLSDTLGVYQGEVTLPDAMRRLDLGVFSITLPTFAVAIYTNGDFQVDFGFPWNEDFSRSFAIEAVIAPGIPITGAAGFYFGKLSSESTKLVPECENGLFRPVLVFGIGIQAGFGKSIHWGILDAGFSLTLFVILEGVIAKWNPYQEEKPKEQETQISDSYYYRVDGKAGLLGKFYGTVDFAIIKANLTLDIEVYFKLTYINYQSITIAVSVSASLKLEIKINLGLFKIKIKLSFYLDLKESFVIEQKGSAPWKPKSTLAECSAIFAYQAANGLPLQTKKMYECKKSAAAKFLRKNEKKIQLNGYLSAALTAAKDEWESGGEKPYYVLLLFMDSRQSFSSFCRAIACWMIACALGEDMDEETLRSEIIREDQLNDLKESRLVSSKEKPVALSLEEINQFMEQQFEFVVKRPGQTEDAVIFPMVPDLTVSLEQQEKELWSYGLDTYNEIGKDKLAELRSYFDELAVQTRKETKETGENRETVLWEETPYSAASYVYADYFLLVARNMVQQLTEALRNYSYRIRGEETPNEILSWIQENRGDGPTAYTLYDLFYANQSHLLNSGTISGSPTEARQLCLSKSQQEEVFYHTLQEGDTLEKIMAKYGVTLEDIAIDQRCASYNGSVAGLFSTAEDSQLNLPCLSQFRVGLLLDQIMKGDGISDFGGMVSRYYLHGLRLDTEGICPKEKGIWVRENAGNLTLPGEAGLYSLTGQQFALPPNYEAGFDLHFDVPKTNNWFRFDPVGEGGHSGTLHFGDGEDISRIKELEQYLSGQQLGMGLMFHGQEGMIKRQARTFPYTEAVSCSFGDEILFACGENDAKRQMRLWMFSNVLKEWLACRQRKYKPVFSARADRLDMASRTMVGRTLARCKPVTAVTFLVRKVEKGSDTSCHAYEIAGAGAEDTKRLAELLSLSAQGKVFYQDMYLGYTAAGAPKEKALTFEASDTVCYFMAQNNLSTVTNPSNMFFALMETGGCSNSCKDIEDLVRLLWEALITNSGGFYLYYYHKDGQEIRGLKDEIFDEKGRASLTLLLSYRTEDQAEGRFVLHDYMNGLLSDEAVDWNTEVCYMQAETTEKRITLAGDESIQELCDGYDTDPSGLLECNPSMRLKENISLRIVGGSYMADDSGRAPGRKLTDIAGYFGITTEDLKRANPQKTVWEELLAPYEAVHLPEIMTVVRKNDTLESLAAFYRVNAAGIAATNAAVRGIFDTDSEGGARLMVPCLEGVQQTMSGAGVLSFSFTADAPSDNDKESAEEMLKKNYTLLAYRVLENAEYRQSKMGLPAGPCEVKAGPGEVKAGPGEGGADRWKYQIDIPYTRLRKKKETSVKRRDMEQDDLYAGIGTLLQMEYSLNDLYGNSMSCALTNECRMPVAAGYTDSLTPLSSWPSAAAWWKLAAAGEAGAGKDQEPKIVLGLSFQSNRYAPKSGTDEADAPAEQENVEWYRNAIRALGVYEGLYFQLLDARSSHYGIKTTMFCNQEKEACLYRWNESLAEQLNRWLFLDERSVLGYLKAVADTQGDASKYEQSCRKRIPPLLEIVIPFSDILSDGEGVALNDAELYELSMAFVLFRDKTKVMSGFETISGISEVSTLIPPYTKTENDNQTKSTMQAFAASFESAMEQEGVCRYKVAEGMSANSKASANRLWAVRQGADENHGIYFSFTQQEDNRILEIPPLSNHLEGRDRAIEIPAYRQQKARAIYFSSVDLDSWMSSVLESIEAMTDAAVLNFLRLLDAKEGTDYYQRMLDGKKEMAEALSGLLTEVFEDETVSTQAKDAARECLCQGLLADLTQFYNVKGVILSEYQMNASPEAKRADAPRLLGSMKPDEKAEKTNISISQMKLTLRSSQQAVQACLVTAPDDVRNEEGGILSELDMSLFFTDLELEHQIGEIEGISDYQDSRWLKFTLPKDSLFRKAAGSVNMPLLLRSYPDIPKLEEQKYEAGNNSGEGGANIFWDYVFSYSRPCHYPQDEIRCHVDFNRQEPETEALSVDKRDFFEAMAVFMTLRDALETDINGFAADIVPDFAAKPKAAEKADGMDDAKEAVQTYLSCMEEVIAALQEKSQKEAVVCGLYQDLCGISYDFTVQEAVEQLGETDALAVIVQGTPPEGLDLPVVEIMPEQYEAFEVKASGARTDAGEVVRRTYCYKTKGGELLPAGEGQRISERFIRIRNLHLLRYQSANTTICISRNVNKTGRRRISDCFVYKTGEIGFGTTLYPSFDFSETVDMTTYGKATPQEGTVFEQLHSFFERLLGKDEHPAITVQLEVTYRRLVGKAAGYSDVPVFFQLPVNGTNNTQEKMEKQWSGCLNDWYTENIGLYEGENWRKDDILVFDLLFMTNQTAEPMPLLRLRNLQLPCKYIKHE